MRIFLRFLFAVVCMYSTAILHAQEPAPELAEEQIEVTETEEAIPTQAVPTEEISAPEVAQEQAPEFAPAVEEQEPTEVTPIEEVPAIQPTEEQTPQAPATEQVQEAPIAEEAAQVQPDTVTQEPVAEEEPPIKIEEIEGIDTVDLKEPRGNWLFKRIWWERAENKYEKIRLLVQEILESRMRFFSVRSEIDKDVLDPFYIAVGLGKGEFQEVLGELTKKLEQAREKDIVLTGKERDLLTTLEKENQMLEQVGLDIESIGQLDTDIDNALSKLMEQINRVRAYEKDAWRYFKEISRVLSDKKARELFYKMEIIYNNVKDIQEYIQQAFTQHFDTVVSTIKENVERIQSNVELFKEKGVDFKAQAQKMIEQVEPSTKQEQDELDEDEEALRQAQDERVEQGWFGSIFSTIGDVLYAIFDVLKSVVVTIWDYTVYIIKLPYNMIFGPKEVVEEEYEQEEFIDQEPQVPVEQASEQTQITEEVEQEVVVPEAKPQIEIPIMPEAPKGQIIQDEQPEPEMSQEVPAEVEAPAQVGAPEQQSETDMVEEELVEESINP